MTTISTAFTVCAGAGFVLVLSPRPWHFESWNAGALIYRFWAALGTLNLFINAVIWRNDALQRALFWCEISIRITISLGIAIPLTSLCINRRLYHIAAGRKSGLSESECERRRAAMFDLCLGFGVPILSLPLHLIFQGHRFNIFEEIGCYPFIYSTPLAVVVVSAPPLIVSLISASYAIRTIIIFRRRKLQIEDVLGSTNMTSEGYFRLTIFAGVEVALCVPLTVYSLALNASQDMYPYVSWAYVHAGFDRIDNFPSIVWRQMFPLKTVVALETTRWSTVLCALVFFVFYGFTAESRRLYRKDLGVVTRWLALGKLSTSKGMGPSLIASAPESLPISFKKTQSRDSFSTFDSSELSTVPSSPV